MPSTPTYTYAPPQRLHFFDEDGFGLYVYGYSSKLNEETLVRTFEVDESKKVPVRLFAQGNTYKLWGLFESDLHLIGPVEKGEPMYLLGANDQGQDMLSRIIFGARVSMSIGLVGVALSFVFGVFLGGISGYYAGDGHRDTASDRGAMSIPTLPLWLGARPRCRPIGAP